MKRTKRLAALLLLCCLLPAIGGAESLNRAVETPLDRLLYMHALLEYFQQAYPHPADMPPELAATFTAMGEYAGFPGYTHTGRPGPGETTREEAIALAAEAMQKHHGLSKIDMEELYVEFCYYFEETTVPAYWYARLHLGDAHYAHHTTFVRISGGEATIMEGHFGLG